MQEPSGDGPTGPEDQTVPLRRAPRPLLVHWAVDAAVAVLVVLFPALLLSWNLVVVGAFGAVTGFLVAPWTLRREAEALARRPEPPVSPS